jgi:hypothetical protein
MSGIKPGPETIFVRHFKAVMHELMRTLPDERSSTFDATVLQLAPICNLCGTRVLKIPDKYWLRPGKPDTCESCPTWHDMQRRSKRKRVE